MKENIKSKRGLKRLNKNLMSFFKRTALISSIMIIPLFPLKLEGKHQTNLNKIEYKTSPRDSVVISLKDPISIIGYQQYKPSLVIEMKKDKFIKKLNRELSNTFWKILRVDLRKTEEGLDIIIRAEERLSERERKGITKLVEKTILRFLLAYGDYQPTFLT